MEQRSELIKGLGLYGATSVAAGTMIGTAIFVVPSVMLQHMGTPAEAVERILRDNPRRMLVAEGSA